MDRGEARRRERALRNENPQSERLCYFLRHHPAKDRLFAAKGQSGGWFKYEDVLPWFRATNEAQLDALVASSRSLLPPHSQRFESRTIDHVKWIRARYGHSFDVTFGDIDRERVAGELPTLTQLLIEYVASNLPQFLPSLSEIDDGSIISALFERYKKVTGGNVSNKIIKCFLLPQVCHLDFKGLLVEDSIIRLIPKACPDLGSLSFESCFTCMTDTNLQFILKRCTELRYLDISGCTYLTTNGMRILSKLGTKITTLLLRWMKAANLDLVRFLLTNMPQLELLNITGCPSIHPTVVEKLIQDFPHVYIQYNVLDDLETENGEEDEVDARAENVLAAVEEDGEDEEQ